MELRDYLHVVWTRRSVILVSVVVTAMTALAVSLVTPTSYKATAEVLLVERDTGSAIFGQLLPEFSSQPERSMQTQLRLIKRRTLVENTIERLDLRMSPAALAAHVAVTASGQTNMITISVTDGDAERAALIANTLADEYVKWSREKRQQSLRSAIDQVDKRLGAVEKSAVALADKAGGTDTRDRPSEVRLGMLTSTYGMLSEKLEQLRINEQLEVGSADFVTPAVVEPFGVSPKPLRNALLGLAVGLVFGVGMAFLWEYLDDTVRDLDTMERIFEKPRLGAIPFAAAADQNAGIAVRDTPGSPRAESYRVLRNAMDFINFEREIKTLVVTSTGPAEGKSTISANLAVALAQAGQKVVYVLSDFRKPVSHEFFGLPNTLGLSALLAGRVSLSQALVRPHPDMPLEVLVAGRMPPNPAELLASDRMKTIIEELEHRADWVIVDTPPVLAVSDGATVSRWAGGVLVVVRLGQTTKAALARTREIMEQTGGNVVGLVASVTAGQLSGGTGYGSYGYGAPGGVGYDLSSQTAYGGYYDGRRSERHVARAEMVARFMPAASFVLAFALVATVFAVLDALFKWGIVAHVVSAVT